MEEAHISAQDEQSPEEISSDPNTDDIMTEGDIQDAVDKSPVTLSSLPSPSVSPRRKKQLCRSQSYPSMTSHVCQICTGVCLCPRCPPNDADADGSGGKPRETPRRRRSWGSLRVGSTGQRHKTDGGSGVCMASQESLQDPEPILPDTEPSVSAALMNGVLFHQGGTEYTECQVCLQQTLSRSRPCCQLPVCDACLRMYIREKVGRRVLSIRCPNPACCDCLCREEILHHLSSELYDRFLQFLAEDNSDPDRKTCPLCNHIANFGQDVTVRKHRTRPNTYQVHCTCGMLWCFPCHAPWHENLSCKQYQRGDRQLREWAKEHHYGQPNANKCPKCKVYIQRSSGCDNMTCSQCRTSFCYRCGERFYHVKFFGNHFSRLSVFGCKYRFKPHEPVKRKMIRGTIFGCQLAALPVCLTLAVGVGGVVAAVLAPAYVVWLGRRSYKYMRKERKRRSQIKFDRQYQEFSRSLYVGCNKVEELRPRSATLVDLPPSSWPPYCKQEPGCITFHCRIE